MPEPLPGEDAAKFRGRLRRFFDRFAVPGESVESARRSWVQVMARHGIEPGAHFTADDDHVVTHPGLLGVIKPPKPLSTMTGDERGAFVGSVSTMMRERWEAAKVADAAPMTSENFTDLQIECAMQLPWGSRGSRVPDTKQCRELYAKVFEQCTAILAAGGQIDIVD